jgi:hypothetical protein
MVWYLALTACCIWTLPAKAPKRDIEEKNITPLTVLMFYCEGTKRVGNLVRKNDVCLDAPSAPRQLQKPKSPPFVCLPIYPNPHA